MVNRWVSVDDSYNLPAHVQAVLDARTLALTGSGGGTGGGTKWYSGPGAPGGATGVIGDFYLNTTNGDVYEKTGASAWTVRDNLTGPQGAAGTPGVGTSGVAVWTPSDATGATDVTSELQAFRAANLGKTIKVADGSTVLLNNAFASVTTGDILLDLTNVTVLYNSSDGLGFAIDCNNTAAASAEVTVSALSLVTVNTNAYVSQLTLGSTLAAKRFDWVAVYSTDANPAKSGGQLGEIFQVGTDEAALALTATRKLNRHSGYVTTVKARKLSAARRCWIKGGTFKANGNTQDHAITTRNTAIRVIGFVDPLVEDVVFDHPWATGLRFQACAAPRFRNITMRDVGNLANFTGYTYGTTLYGMNDNADGRNLVVRNGRHAAFTTDGNGSSSTTWWQKGIPTNVLVTGVHGYNCHASVVDTHEEGDTIVIDGVNNFHPTQDEDINPGFAGLTVQIRSARTTVRNLYCTGGFRGVKVSAVDHGFEDTTVLENININRLTSSNDTDIGLTIDDVSALTNKRHVYFSGTMHDVGIGFSVGKDAKLTVSRFTARRVKTLADAGAGSTVVFTESPVLDYRDTTVRAAPFLGVLCRSDAPNGGCTVAFLDGPRILKGTEATPTYLLTESDTTATKSIFVTDGLLQYNPGAVTATLVSNPAATTLSIVTVTSGSGGGGAAGAPGSKWYSGSGAPSGATGIVGDWYLNTASGDVYEKTGASTWTLRDNLTGPAGSTGPAGGGGSGGTIAFAVSASNSLAGFTAEANYICDGTGDQAEIQAALDALPDGGGEVVLLPGTYNITATIKIKVELTSLRFMPGAVVRWTGVTGRTPLIQVLISNSYLYHPYCQGSGSKGNGIGVQIGGQASTEPIVAGDQPGGVHVYQPRFTNLDTGLEFGIQSDGSQSVGDCVMWGGRITNCKIGVKSVGFVNYVHSPFISGCNIGIQQSSERTSGKIVVNGATINQWASAAIEILNGRGTILRDMWMEHTATQTGVPTECIRIAPTGSSSVRNLTMDGMTHVHPLDSATGTAELYGVRLSGNVLGMTINHLEFTNELPGTAFIRQDATHAGGGNVIRKLSIGDDVPAGYSYAMVLSNASTLGGSVAIQEIPGPAGSNAGTTIGGSTPNPSNGTYNVDVTGAPNAATYWAKSSTGHVAAMSQDTAATSGLKAVIEGLAANDTHFHFRKGRYHFIDAPLGSEAYANTETGSSFSKLSGLAFSGDSLGGTILSTRSNTITASPDLAVLLFTNCDDVTIKDMTVEFCGAYMSTMEAINCNQGNGFHVSRVKFNRSKSTVFTYDGGDVGKSAKRSTVRDCLFLGRPEMPMVDLVTTGGTLTNATTYTYVVSYVDLDAAYQTTVTAAASGTTATLTTPAAHGMVAGDVVTVLGMSVAGYNGQFTVTAAPTTTTLTYTVTAGLGAGTGGTLIGPALTKPSDPSTPILTANATSSAKVYLPIGPYSTSKRVVYRYDGTNWKLVQTVNDNTTTTWTDTGVAGTTVTMPVSNKSNIPHSGIQLLATKGCLITGNYVDGAGDTDITGTAAQGIRLSQKQSVSCDYNIVLGNTVRQSGSHGIYLVAAKNNVVSGNEVSNPGKVATKAQAIRLDTSASIGAANNLVTGNICFDDQTAASWSGGVSTSPSITLAASTINNVVQGNNLSGSAVAASISDVGTTNIIRNNQGFSLGAASITPGASPYTYTAGSSPELVYITGGTVSAVVKNAITLAAATGVSVWLDPNESVVVTYSVAPTMVRDRK